VLAEKTATVPQMMAYRPGEFFLRELPPLRAVLDAVHGLGLLVVGGYTDLDPAGRPGLGAHAHAEFGVPVIGVAKTAFRTATHAVPVLRGHPARPLYITAAGMPAKEAADLVRHMTRALPAARRPAPCRCPRTRRSIPRHRPSGPCTSLTGSAARGYLRRPGMMPTCGIVSAPGQGQMRMVAAPLISVDQ
jgi:deoxyribonuclease V